MKKIIYSALTITAFLGALSVKGQTADEIVSKYIDAIGGKDKISQVNSVYLEGITQVMGNEAPTVITLVNGKGYKSESDFNGQKSIQCITDKGGWSVNPMAGGNAEAMPDDIYKASRDQINVGGALYDYAAKGYTVELQGKEGNNYKLKLVTKDKNETTYFIDQASYLISKIVKKSSMMGKEVEISIQFADYRKTDAGYLLPFTINTDLGQFQLATTISKATINKTIDPAVFNMPK